MLTETSEKRHRKQEFDVCQRIHEPEYDYIAKPNDPKTETCIQPSRRLEVNLEPDSFTEEKYVTGKRLRLVESHLPTIDRYALFAQYQEKVHKESPAEISRNGFKRFLCSGMKHSTFIENGKQRNVGSYHQCYRVDGRLVALGVLDLMPNCVSSVYLMWVNRSRGSKIRNSTDKNRYHHDFAYLEFGKVSALREIALAVEEGYRYYYMGMPAST